MADKPSRALVIYGDGFAPLVASPHSHLHSFASLACCGFLSLRDAPHHPEIENDREVRELAQLLDSYAHYTSLKGEHDNIVEDKDAMKMLSMQTLSERFMGIRAALITASSGIRSFAKNIGFTVLQIDDLIKQGNTGTENQKKVHNELSATMELLQLLGSSQGKFLEKSEFDLVFFHIRANEMVKVFKDKMIIRTDADCLNKFVGEIMQMAHSESAVASRLLVSIILSYGTIPEQDCLTVSLAPTKMNSDLSLLRPRQSYTMKGGMLVNDIRHNHPLLLAQLQNSVTRRDLAKEFTFKEIEKTSSMDAPNIENLLSHLLEILYLLQKQTCGAMSINKNGGNLTILADRFLHEIAFKLWKAPKYGA